MPRVTLWMSCALIVVAALGIIVRMRSDLKHGAENAPPVSPECTADYVPNERRQIAQLATAARRDCQWVMVFDVDEYIVGEDASRYFGNVHAYLQSAPPSTSRAWWGLPVQHFAWIVMSTHGLEQRPRHQLTIETYTRGKLDSGRQFKTVNAMLK